MLAHRGAAFLDPLVVDEEAEIVPDRRLELGLVVHQLEDLHVGLHAGDGGVEGLAGHALGDGLAFEAGEAGAEIGLRRGGGDGDREPEKGEGEFGGSWRQYRKAWLTRGNLYPLPPARERVAGGASGERARSQTPLSPLALSRKVGPSPLQGERASRGDAASG